MYFYQKNMNWEIYRTGFPQVVFNGSMVTIYYIIQPPHVRFMAKTSPTSDAERHNQNVIRLVYCCKYQTLANLSRNANYFRGPFSNTILSLFIAYLYLHLFWAVQKLIHKSNAKSKTLSNMYLILIVSRWHYCLQEQNNQFVIGLILAKNGRFWNSLKCVLIYLWSFFPYLSTWRIFCWRIILMF